MSTEAEQHRLLTVAEVASEWRQHPDTIYRKVATGEMIALDSFVSGARPAEEAESSG